ncbi:MAG TPA: polyhydroxyalkanoic acid system family protein [Polyangiaceae bacterium]|nr:polyhydroxyalkanoic acid system family protein [Polyangiaceae bacterium]
MKHSVPHTVGKETARKVARSAFDSYKARFAEFSPQTNWTSDDKADIGFTVKGMTLKGSVQVTDKTIDMDLDVPFLLKPFQGTAIKVIEGEIQNWLGKAQRGELA